MPWQASLDKQWLNQPDNFAFDSVADTHSWPDIYVHPLADPVGPDSIPLINLNDPNLSEKISKACQEWGIFQITGHGVPTESLNRFERQIHRLFALPIEQKLKATKAVGDVSGYGLVPISPFFSKYMWSEGFTIADSPRRHAEKLWPNDYTSFCDAMEEYKKMVKRLGIKLLHVMLISLGLTEEEINQIRPVGDPNAMSTSFHLNSYPVCPDPTRAIGLAAHTDSSLLTIVYQNGVSGLQVLRPKDDVGPTRWVTVPTVHNTFVINLGDLMHILSNGKFRNVVHRAVVNQARHRISAGYFCGPSADVHVSPLAKLIGPEGGPLYRGINWPEYQKIRGRVFDKALEELKL